MPRVYILDTSVFVNPASGQSFGNSATSAVIGFLERARRATGLEFLVPPSVYAELMHFAEEPKIAKDLLPLLRQQAPRRHEIKVPGIFIYTLVDNMRDRVDRGLRLAERHVREALQSPPAEPTSEGGKPIRQDAEAIGRLRETYRRIMREGSLDSRADVDLLLLTYEQDATLVTADVGVQTWADEMGLRLLPYDQLPAVLDAASVASDR